MNIITFDKTLKGFILDAFDKKVNTENIIVECSNPEQKVLSPDGLEVALEEFAGIKKGSEVFIKSDLISLMNLCDALS